MLSPYNEYCIEARYLSEKTSEHFGVGIRSWDFYCTRPSGSCTTPIASRCGGEFDAQEPGETERITPRLTIWERDR